VKKGLQQYKSVERQGAVGEASPVELIVLVYARVLDNLRLAQRKLSSGEDCSVPVDRALEFIQQGLCAAVNYERGGDISKNLGALYDWAIREILQARVKREPARLDGVITVLKDLESAWVAVKEQGAQYHQSATSPSREFATTPRMNDPLSL
jgi:flagellar protein FliS